MLPVPQAGHQVILQCESDPGAQQVRMRSSPHACVRLVQGVLRRMRRAVRRKGTRQRPPTRSHGARRPLYAAQLLRSATARAAWRANASMECAPRDAAPHVVMCATMQVLRRALPGILLEPDVCALRALPEVRARASIAPCDLAWPHARTCGRMHTRWAACERARGTWACRCFDAQHVSPPPPMQGTDLLVAAPPAPECGPRTGGATTAEPQASGRRGPETCDHITAASVGRMCLLT